MLANVADQSDDGRQVRQSVKSAAGTLSSLRAARLLFTNCRFHFLFVTLQSLIRGRLLKRFLSKRPFYLQLQPRTADHLHQPIYPAGKTNGDQLKRKCLH